MTRFVHECSIHVLEDDPDCTDCVPCGDCGAELGEEHSPKCVVVRDHYADQADEARKDDELIEKLERAR